MTFEHGGNRSNTSKIVNSRRSSTKNMKSSAMAKGERSVNAPKLALKTQLKYP